MLVYWKKIGIHYLIQFWFDPTDILGNAYISMFFTSGQNPQLSQQALSAYAQAVSISSSSLSCIIQTFICVYIHNIIWPKLAVIILPYNFICAYLQEKIDKASSMNPDLHFNRATVIILSVAFSHTFSDSGVHQHICHCKTSIISTLLHIQTGKQPAVALPLCIAGLRNYFLSPVVPVWRDVQFSSGWIQPCCSSGSWLGRCSGERKTAAGLPRPAYSVNRE